jgi:hypothetical protein
MFPVASKLAPVRKVFASICAAVLTAGPIAIGAAFGWHLDQAVAVLIVGIVTPLAGYLTPANQEPADQ